MRIKSPTETHRLASVRKSISVELIHLSRIARKNIKSDMTAPPTPSASPIKCTISKRVFVSIKLKSITKQYNNNPHHAVARAHSLTVDIRCPQCGNPHNRYCASPLGYTIEA